MLCEPVLCVRGLLNYNYRLFLIILDSFCACVHRIPSGSFRFFVWGNVAIAPKGFVVWCELGIVFHT